MILVLGAAATVSIASDLAQGGLDFATWGNYGRIAWSYALFDAGGGEGAFLFNIFVTPALLATAIVLLCTSSLHLPTARRVGRWFMALVILALIQTPMALAGHVVFQSLFVTGPIAGQGHPTLGWIPTRIAFQSVLTILRFLACMAMFLGVRGFLVARREDAVRSAVDPADTPRGDLASTPQTLRTPIFVGLAAAAGLAIGVVTAIHDVNLAESLRSAGQAGGSNIGSGIWGVLKFGAQDVASATTTDPSAVATPLLLLLAVIALRRVPRGRGTMTTARAFRAFALIELLVMPTFVIATVQVNAGAGAVELTDFYAWSATRALVCLAAFLGTLGVLHERQAVSEAEEPPAGAAASSEDRLPKALPHVDVAVLSGQASTSIERSRSTAPSSGVDARGRAMMSNLLGWSSGLGVLFGIAIIVYDVISPSLPIGVGGAVESFVGEPWWDALRDSTGLLALGQSGDFLFIFGPLLLVLAALLRASVGGGHGEAARRWLIAVALGEWIITVIYLIAGVIPPAVTSGLYLFSFVGWCVVRLLLCFAAVAAALELPSPVRREPFTHSPTDHVSPDGDRADVERALVDSTGAKTRTA